MIDGGWQGLKLVAIIDLVLGPALTLLLFKPGKPRLVMDMSIIAAIQLSALVWGFYAAYGQQTVAIVFAESEFTTLSYSDYRAASQEVQALGFHPVPLAQLGTERPRQVFTEILTAENLGQYMVEVLNGKPSLRERTDKYKKLSEHYAEIRRYRLSDQELADDTIRTALADQTSQSLKGADVYRFKARYGSGLLMIDRNTQRITKLLALSPNTETQAAQNPVTSEKAS